MAKYTLLFTKEQDRALHALADTLEISVADVFIQALALLHSVVGDAETSSGTTGVRSPEGIVR